LRKGGLDYFTPSRKGMVKVIEGQVLRYTRAPFIKSPNVKAEESLSHQALEVRRKFV
jgi:hypothetical protein